ncbi:pterin-4-alpha-carbinolamine dehydratase [compost metagenome]
MNAIAYTIHSEDHHPELVVTYKQCVVKYDTHSVNEGKGGLSQNDFICAAKLDAIYAQSVPRNVN